MDKVAVSRAVSRLLDKNYLLRQLHGQDRRRSELKLSAKGRAVFDQIVPLALALSAASCRCWPTANSASCWQSSTSWKRRSWR